MTDRSLEDVLAELKRTLAAFTGTPVVRWRELVAEALSLAKQREESWEATLESLRQSLTVYQPLAKQYEVERDQARAQLADWKAVTADLVAKWHLAAEEVRGQNNDVAPVERFAVAAIIDGLADELEAVLEALAEASPTPELRNGLQWALDYILRLEAATSWIFATRSYAHHPATDFDMAAFKLCESVLGKQPVTETS